MAESDSLRERALYAWRNREEIAKERERAWAAERLSYLLEDRLDVHVSPVTGTVDVEGLTFARVIRRTQSCGTEESYEELNLLWTCPECGEDELSGDITDLQDLGQALESWPPPHRHTERQEQDGKEA